jgi:hypothetical protein
MKVASLSTLPSALRRIESPEVSASTFKAKDYRRSSLIFKETVKPVIHLTSILSFDITRG